MRAAIVVAAVLGGLAWEKASFAAEDELTLELGSRPGAPQDALTIDLRRIPKGTFLMGSPPSEVGRDPDEIPHSVAITRSFWLGKTPVTRAQFARFVAETKHVTEAEKAQGGGYGWDGKALVQRKDFNWKSPGFAQRDEDPVVLVTFADAMAFASWVSRRTGRRARLPSEAEWEYAARAGSVSAWFAATKDEEALTLGWFKQNSGAGTHPVGTKRANAFGLFDMTGNVYEWCRDVYGPYPTAEALDPENVTSAAGETERRVLRGGSWLRDPKRGRSAARHRAAPGSRNADGGFRIALDDDSATVTTAPSGGVATVSGGATSPAAPPRAAAASAGSAPWLLAVAPFVGVALVLGWVTTRRRLRGRKAATSEGPTSGGPRNLALDSSAPAAGSVAAVARPASPPAPVGESPVAAESPGLAPPAPSENPDKTEPG